MSSYIFIIGYSSALIMSAVHAEPASTLIADLDRDGRPETFLVSDNGESLTTLTVKRPGKTTITARDIAWSLEPATLTRAANGSVLLNTSHIGIGRSPHEQTLTIAYRGGAYRVIGITRSNWDRVEPNKSVRCDINLLTGRGTVNDRPVRRGTQSKAVTAWAWDAPLLAGCEIP